MKDCKKIHPLLPLYIEGQLSSSEKNKVDKHLGVCETARMELEHFRHLLEGMRNLPDPQVPADLHGKIMAKLSQHPQSMTPRHHFWGPQIWGLAAAAVMVFVLFNQYPNWKESWKISPPQVEQEKISNVPQQSAPRTSTNTFTATNNAPAPAQPGLGGVLGPNKKNQPVGNANFGVQGYEYAPVNGKNLEESNAKDYSGPGQTKTTDIVRTLGIPAETNADNLSDGNAGLMKMRSAKKTLQRPEANIVTGTNNQVAAGAPVIAWPPAPTPTVPSLDQSYKSVAYSREQSVMTWNNNSGPSTVESQELVTDADTFQKYWQIPHPGETPPTVDFTKDAVVILNAGEKPTVGYSIHVTHLEEKDDQLIIHYKVDVPSPVVAVAAMITHPWVLQVIPKPSKPVVFIKDP